MKVALLISVLTLSACVQAGLDFHPHLNQVAIVNNFSVCDLSRYQPLRNIQCTVGGIFLASVEGRKTDLRQQAFDMGANFVVVETTFTNQRGELEIHGRAYRKIKPIAKFDSARALPSMPLVDFPPPAQR